jgi:hypothetical protein
MSALGSVMRKPEGPPITFSAVLKKIRRSRTA